MWPPVCLSNRQATSEKAAFGPLFFVPIFMPTSESDPVHESSL